MNNMYEIAKAASIMPEKMVDLSFRTDFVLSVSIKFKNFETATVNCFQVNCLPNN